MSAIKRVKEALQKLETGDFEAALIPACIAVDATAKKQFPKIKTNNERYKEFLRNNIQIIGLIAFNISATAFRLAIDHPDLEIKKEPDGSVSLEDIIYHVIRCGLLHEGELHENLEISKRSNVIFSVQDSKLIIGQGLAAGLIVSVILSPIYANVSEKIPVTFSRAGINMTLSDLWGKREWFMNTIITSLQTA